MPESETSSIRTSLIGLGVGLFLCVLSVWLLQVETRPASALQRASYDSLFEMTSRWQPSMSNAEVIIVYLDLDSYLLEKQSPTEAWDRRIHARLLRALRQAGARAVVFDIVFGDPSKDPEVDLDLASAMREQGQVIVGAELNQASHDTQRGDWIKSATLVLPPPTLRSAAAGWGIADLLVEDDFVVRQLFDGLSDPPRPSLLRTTLEVLRSPHATSRPGEDDNRWTHYYGPPLTLPHVSYSSVLRPDALPADLFRGKVVLVGARPMTPSFTGIRDEFRSPFHTWGETELFIPGVEVHATQILNGIRGDWLRRVSNGTEVIAYCLFALFATVGLVRLRPLAATACALGLEVAVVVVAATLFVTQKLWSPWLILSLIQIPIGLGASFLIQSVDWYRRRRALEEERRRADLKIREQAALLDKAQDAILVYDLKMGVEYVNPAATFLYGWTLRDFKDVPEAAALFDVSNQEVRHIRDVTSSQGEWRGELEQRDRSGQPIAVASRWTLIRHEDGRPKAFLVINTNVTERRRLERHLQQVERMETVGALAGGMAHDLNNTFSPIQLGIQMLRRQKLDEESSRTLEVVEASCRRGIEMVKQVLLYARGERVERQRLNVGHLLRDMERFVQETFPSNIEVARMAPDDLWSVEGNEAQLHQVLLNLCVNARDAMPRGGHLTLAADNASLDASEAQGIPGGRAGEFVVLWVSDTGEGIAPSLLPRLFEPFFTTKPVGQGTGLGLATVATLVREHHGFLGVKSEPGEGTTFEVYLPRFQQLREPELPSSSSVVGHGKRVLLLGGEQVLLEMMRSTLLAHGYGVETLGGMADLSRALESSQVGATQLVFHFDPPASEAIERIEEIRSAWPSLSVLVVGQEEHLAGLGPRRESPKIRCLARPYSAEAFLASIGASS